MFDGAACAGSSAEYQTLIPEWQWLHSFGLALRSAEAMSRREAFPPEFHHNIEWPGTAPHLVQVSERIVDSQDNVESPDGRAPRRTSCR